MWHEYTVIGGFCSFKQGFLLTHNGIKLIGNVYFGIL